MRMEVKYSKSLLILFLIQFFSVLFLAGCEKSNQPEKEWKFYKQIKTGNSKPNGIVYLNGKLWISDTPNNRIIEIDTIGKMIKEIYGFKRPMHISLYGNKIFVPEFLVDSIKAIDINTGKVSAIPIELKPDAPGGVSVSRSDTAIADFYNHSIISKSNGKTIAIGKKGHGNGELFYPTDVSFSNNLLYVADAYNNRIEVFNKNGRFKKIIGSGNSIKTAVGIFVNDKYIFVAGFENNKIFQFYKDGSWTQTITSNLHHPSDMVISGNTLFAANYGSNSISMFIFK